MNYTGEEGDAIRWWTMWGYVMAISGGRNIKVTSWEVVDIVVVANAGDSRDIVAIGTESDVIGSIFSCGIVYSGRMINSGLV
jgi:hypothetical protein